MEGRNEVTEQEEKSLPQQLKYLLTHFNMNQHESTWNLSTLTNILSSYDKNPRAQTSKLFIVVKSNITIEMLLLQ